MKLSTEQMLALAQVVKPEIKKLEALSSHLKTMSHDLAPTGDMGTFNYLSQRLDAIVQAINEIKDFAQKHKLNVTHDLWGGQYTNFMQLLDQLVESACNINLDEVNLTAESLIAVNTYIDALNIAKSLLPDNQTEARAQIQALEEALTDKRTAFTESLSDDADTAEEQTFEATLLKEMPEPQEELFGDDPIQAQRNAVIAEFDRIIQKFQKKLDELERRKTRVGSDNAAQRFNVTLRAGRTLLENLRANQETFKEGTATFSKDFETLQHNIQGTFDTFGQKENLFKTERQNKWGAWATQLKSELCKLLNIRLTTKTTKKFDTMKAALTDLKAPETEEAHKGSSEEPSNQSNEP